MKNLRMLLMLILLSTAPLLLYACATCELAQPKLFRGITHGPGPNGNFDFVIVTIAAVVVSLTLVLSIKYLFRPGEKDPHHIKNIVID